ncbi:MAG: hypothetical protein WB443_13300 [Nitrososphaeraceae archaeon]
MSTTVLLATAPIEFSFSTGQAAHTVICGSILASSLNHSTRLTFDSQGNLWVVDSGNSRILEYNAPFTTGEALL